MSGIGGGEREAGTRTPRNDGEESFGCQGTSHFQREAPQEAVNDVEHSSCHSQIDDDVCTPTHTQAHILTHRASWRREMGVR